MEAVALKIHDFSLERRATVIKMRNSVIESEGAIVCYA
jgi:hypothetical protein